MKNLRLPILLIFGLLSSLASAKEIYVASFGKDSNPGSQNEPYATLGKAFTVLENDDKIFILDILSIQNEASGTGTGQMEDDCLGIKFQYNKKKSRCLPFHDTFLLPPGTYVGERPAISIPQVPCVEYS